MARSGVGCSSLTGPGWGTCAGDSALFYEPWWSRIRCRFLNTSSIAIERGLRSNFFNYLAARLIFSWNATFILVCLSFLNLVVLKALIIFILSICEDRTSRYHRLLASLSRLLLLAHRALRATIFAVDVFGNPLLVQHLIGLCLVEWDDFGGVERLGYVDEPARLVRDPMSRWWCWLHARVATALGGIDVILVALALQLKHLYLREEELALAMAAFFALRHNLKQIQSVWDKKQVRSTWCLSGAQKVILTFAKEW